MNSGDYLKSYWNQWVKDTQMTNFIWTDKHIQIRPRNKIISFYEHVVTLHVTWRKNHLTLSQMTSIKFLSREVVRFPNI